MSIVKKNETMKFIGKWVELEKKPSVVTKNQNKRKKDKSMYYLIC